MTGTAKSNDEIALALRPVILSGGAGTRLWPMSRSFYPKQLLTMGQPETMLQATARRASGPMFAAPIIVTAEEQRFLILDQMEKAALPAEVLLLEPDRRNTAASIALAALHASIDDENAILFVMPSDHLIQDDEAMKKAIAAALPVAQDGGLVTFGMKPTSPETGYGYIEAGHECGTNGVLHVARFVEKPDLTTAERYVAGGKHFWNSGMFLFSAKAFLEELERHEPDIARACRDAMAKGETDGKFYRPDKDLFLASPSKSIDYAVMEKTDRAFVVPADFGWSDVGSWMAVWDVSEKDEDGNVRQGDIITIDSKNSFVRAYGNVTLATLGIEDMVVVATTDAILVMPKERSQESARVVAELEKRDTEKHLFHSTVFRPWGSYETMDRGERFQTKRIIVKPGAKLSLQKHKFRSEHWIVVSGVARVTVGDDVRDLGPNESTYVPVGTLHRLENPGDEPLHLVEVQCGSYLGEDDIERVDDVYGRKGNQPLS